MFQGSSFWCLNSSSLNINLLIMCSNGNATPNSLNVVTECVFVKFSVERIIDMFVQS